MPNTAHQLYIIISLSLPDSEIDTLFLFITKHPGYYWQAKLDGDLDADLRWWNELLPQFNGVRLLDDRNHVSVSLDRRFQRRPRGFLRLHRQFQTGLA
jgi:hypothetical protein